MNQMSTRRRSVNIKKETSGRGASYIAAEINILLDLVEYEPLGQGIFTNFL